MKLEKVKLSDLRLVENNIRNHPANQITQLIKAVKQFGQTRPLVVDEGGIILAGNGLYTALTEMGESYAFVYRVVGLTEVQRKKLMLSDNKLYTLGTDNMDNQMLLLRELGQQGDFEIPGFDEEILKSLLDSGEIGGVEIGGLEDEGMLRVGTADTLPDQLHTDSSGAGTAVTTTKVTTMEKVEMIICPECGTEFIK